MQLNDYSEGWGERLYMHRNQLPTKSLTVSGSLVNDLIQKTFCHTTRENKLFFEYFH